MPKLGLASNNYRFVETSNYLIDRHTTSTAFSLRKIQFSQVNCIKVRRSNDNTEQVFGFVSDTLDTTSLLNFVGSNSGYVVEWYGANGFIAFQAISTNQPRIVNNGAVDSVNGKPSIYFNGNNWLNLNKPATFSYCFAVHKTTSLPVLASYLVGGNATGLLAGAPDSVFVPGGAGFGFVEGANSIISAPQTLNVLRCYTYSPGKLYTNSVEASYSPISSGIPLPITVGAIGTRTDNPYFAFTGYASEILLFNSNKSNARVDIESELISYYGIS